MYSPSNPWPPYLLIAAAAAVTGWAIYVNLYAEPNFITGLISLIVIVVCAWALRDNYM